MGGSLIPIALAGIWIFRVSLTDNFVRSQLDEYDVPADYEIADITLNHQVIRNLVIGDPKNPDFTAERLDIYLSAGSGVPAISSVEVTKGRLYGRLVSGRLSFGALDKFMDPNDTSPLRLPDFGLTVHDGGIRIDSEYGAIGGTLTGSGHLRGGFKGDLALVSDTLNFGDCALVEPSYYGTVAIVRESPRLAGPIRMKSLSCSDGAFAANDMAARLNLELGPQFNQWSGDVNGQAQALSGGGAKARDLAIKGDFAGTLASTKGTVALTAAALSANGFAGKGGTIAGTYQLGSTGKGLSAGFQGNTRLTHMALPPEWVRALNGAAQAESGPVRPLVQKLAGAFGRAASALSGSADVTVDIAPDRSHIIIANLLASSRSGAKLATTGPVDLLFSPGQIASLGAAQMRLSGGGLPAMSLHLRPGAISGGVAGTLQMDRYSQGLASLSMSSLAFSSLRDGSIRFSGGVGLSGPFPGGAITGLQLPVNGIWRPSGGWSLWSSCTDFRFAALQTGSLQSGPQKISVCPNGDAIVGSSAKGLHFGGRIAALDWRAQFGGSPFAIAAKSVSVGQNRKLSGRDFRIALGNGEQQTIFSASQFDAVLGNSIAGTVNGGNAKVANVPLLMQNISGSWRYANGGFSALSDLEVIDEAPVSRFLRMRVRGAVLNFADGRITATGLLREPMTDRVVANADISHNLANSSGNAELRVDNLVFDDALQPEMLTPLTLGVVANVQGSVEGLGTIRWDQSDNGVQSEGRFRTTGINLAAAFGPVTGLSGEIAFSDLLGLETEPGQTVNLSEVNPGVAVFGGQVRYQLLPDLKVAIEGGEWPFAGGMLRLEPTVWDLGTEAPRRMVFAVEGVDAAQFLSQFDFQNLNATGIFDGRLPMVFDQDGGRITGGYLTARTGGGSLAYVGELSYENLGVFGNFAFQALKSLRYRSLTIGMEGALDGEIITEVKFDGLQQGDDAAQNFITRQIAKLPIQFNVRIEAPFMQLISSAKAYYDPSLLVGQNLPALLRQQEELKKPPSSPTPNESSVQQSESEP